MAAHGGPLGLQDTNLARVRATQTYLMRCDYVFIVAGISRAITDQSLKSSLYSILSRHVPLEWEESAGGSMKLAVVCTKSEVTALLCSLPNVSPTTEFYQDINQKTARREFCGPNKRIPESVMNQIDRDIEKAKADGDKAHKKELKRKSVGPATEYASGSRARRQQFLLVDARNNHVKEGLQAAYASKVPGGRLQVFCVSNTTYEKFSRKGHVDMVRASGIPQLRQFCHSVTARARLLETKHFLQSKLSSLLNSINLWADTTPVLPTIEHGGPDESIFEALKDVEQKVCTISCLLFSL